MSEPQPFDNEIRYGFLLKTLFGVVVGMILTCVFIYWLYFFFLDLEKKADPPPPVLAEAGDAIQVPGPLLLSHPENELDRSRAETADHLTSYGWIDESAGVVHVPIDRAIDLVLERGLSSPSTETAEDATMDSESTATDEAPSES